MPVSDSLIPRYRGSPGSASTIFDVNMQFRPPCTGPGALDSSVTCTDDWVHGFAR
jgi:hypothetical protein